MKMGNSDALISSELLIVDCIVGDAGVVAIHRWLNSWSFCLRISE